MDGEMKKMKQRLRHMEALLHPWKAKIDEARSWLNSKRGGAEDEIRQLRSKTLPESYRNLFRTVMGLPIPADSPSPAEVNQQIIDIQNNFLKTRMENHGSPSGMEVLQGTLRSWENHYQAFESYLEAASIALDSFESAEKAAGKLNGLQTIDDKSVKALVHARNRKVKKLREDIEFHLDEADRELSQAIEDGIVQEVA